ncbi:MAG: hypothetical protein ACLQNE_40750 [Thermoguttaceae bacterium]
MNIDETLRRMHAARNNPFKACGICEQLVANGANVVELLVAALRSSDPEIRSGAALALGYANSFPDSRCDLTPAVQPLVYAVGDCDPWVAFHAAKALWFFWKSDERCDLEANDILGQMVGFLEESSDPELRVAAADECRWNGRCAELLIPRLIGRLTDPVLEVRFAAGRSLWTFGPAAREALPTFMEWLESESAEEVFVAAAGVAQIDRSYREAMVPVLLESFARLGSAFRPKGVFLLDAVLESDPREIAALARCYEERRDAPTRLAVVSALVADSLQLDGTLPVLVRAVLDEDPQVAAVAADGLGRLGPAAAAGVPSLIERLDAELMKGEPEEPARHRLVLFLCIAAACIGPAAEPAIPYLELIEEFHSCELRDIAREALRRISLEPAAGESD